MARQRLKPELRREVLLDHALAAARQYGYAKVTRQQIATTASCSTGLVSSYFGTMPDLRRTLMRAAVTREILDIVADGLALRDPFAMRAPDRVKNEALKTIAART